MNHRAIYNNIITKAYLENRQRHRGIYYEEHHIKPKCLGGADIDKNKVLLTPREHYVCHKLLTFIYPKNDKIVNAYFRMTFSKTQGYIVSSRDYAYARELMATTPKSEETKKKIKDNHSHYWKDKHHSEETRKKQREKSLGRKATIEARKNMSNSRIGMKFSKDHCENIRKSKTGENNPNYGKERTQQTKENISKANIGKPSSRKGKSLLQVKIEKYGEIEGLKQYNEWIIKLKIKAKNRNAIKS